MGATEPRKDGPGEVTVGGGLTGAARAGAGPTGAGTGTAGSSTIGRSADASMEGSVLRGAGPGRASAEGWSDSVAYPGVQPVATRPAARSAADTPVPISARCQRIAPVFLLEGREETALELPVSAREAVVASQRS